jgi:hypothetical protein
MIQAAGAEHSGHVQGAFSLNASHFSLFIENFTTSSA